MFAVIKTGGLQYRVAEDDVVRVGRLAGNAGEIVQIERRAAGGRRQAAARHARGLRRVGRGRGARPEPRPESDRVQEAPPQEFAAQARPPAGLSRVVRISEILTDGARRPRRPRVNPHRSRRPRARRRGDKSGEAEAKAKAPAEEGRKLRQKSQPPRENAQEVTIHNRISD